MEFYNESSHIANGEYICEFCNKKIEVGQRYWNERGKFCGEFFTRKLHDLCHCFESEFCREVDNEFTWEEIIEYVTDNHCNDCENYEDCETTIFTCPKIREQYSDRLRPTVF